MNAIRLVGACLLLALTAEANAAQAGGSTGAAIAVVARAGNPAMAAAGRSESTVLVSDPVEVGDAQRGLAFAQKTCAGCHNVLGSDGASPNRQAPPFKAVANTPGMSITALTVWSRTSHPTMPNLVIEPNDMDDLIAYVLSLKEAK